MEDETGGAGGASRREPERDLLAERRARRGDAQGEPAQVHGEQILIRRAEAAEQQAHALEERLASIQERLREAEQESAALSERLVQREEELRRSTERLAGGERELGSVSSRLVQREEELRRLSGRLADREDDLRLLSGRLAQRDDDLRAVSERLGEREQQLGRLEHEIVERVRALEQRVIEVGRELAGERSAREAAERELAALRAAHGAIEPLIGELKSTAHRLRLAAQASDRPPAEDRAHEQTAPQAEAMEPMPQRPSSAQAEPLSPRAGSEPEAEPSSQTEPVPGAEQISQSEPVPGAAQLSQAEPVPGAEQISQSESAAEAAQLSQAESVPGAEQMSRRESAAGAEQISQTEFEAAQQLSQSESVPGAGPISRAGSVPRAVPARQAQSPSPEAAAAQEEPTSERERRTQMTEALAAAVERLRARVAAVGEMHSEQAAGGGGLSGAERDDVAEAPFGVAPVAYEPPPAVAAERRSWLAGAIRRLAQSRDAKLAGELVLELLRAHGLAASGPLGYGVLLEELGEFRLRAGVDGTTIVQAGEGEGAPGPPAFRLQGGVAAFAELAGGGLAPVGIMRRPAGLRVRGSRRRARRLMGERRRPAALADLARAGVTVWPGLLLAALAEAVDPAWTARHDLTVQFAIEGVHSAHLLVTAADGHQLRLARVDGDSASAQTRASATVHLDELAFLCLISGEPLGSDRRILLEGDREALERLLAWTDRAQGIRRFGA